MGGDRDHRRLFDVAGKLALAFHLAAPAASATPLGARPDPLGCCVVAGRLGIRLRYEQSPLMLWWLIGVWLASGAVLPVFWLLSMAYRAASKRIGPKGLYVLSGLVSIGAACPVISVPVRRFRYHNARNDFGPCRRPGADDVRGGVGGEADPVADIGYSPTISRSVLGAAGAD